MKHTACDKAKMLFVVLFAGLMACQSMPFSKAQTLDQKAFALYGTFVVFEEQAATLVQNSQTPQSVKTNVAKVDAKVKPIMDSLLGSVRVYETVQADLAAGKTTQDKMVIATANLTTWVQQAEPVVNDLVAAVKGAKNGP